MSQRPLLALLTGAALLGCPLPARAQNTFTEVDLVSDIPGRAISTDTNLQNPWGLAPGGSGVFWSSNNGTGTSTLYRPDGSTVPLIVHIPSGENTGINVTLSNSEAFEIPSADTTARALFIFVSEGGVISAWSNRVDPNNAITVATIEDANYKGATIGRSASGPRLYTANFEAGTVDVFDRTFHKITLSGSFTDPDLPTNYVPFNVQNVGGQILVSFAQKEPGADDETAGPGLGIVDLFDADGNLQRRLVTGGALNAPWGMVLAPPAFGGFGGKLLVGNFGDGRINAYSLASGAYAGPLVGATGDTISVDGLWGLHFGLAVNGPEVANRLYFAAGLDDEAHGLFGYLAPVNGEVCASDAMTADDWDQQCTLGNHDLGRRFPRHGVSADSIRALISCATTFSQAFGANGCFTASRSLLLPHRRKDERADLARTFLALELDRCAGLVCDSTIVACATQFPDRDDRRRHGRWGDDDGGGRGHDHTPPATFTVADIVTMIDSSLCTVHDEDLLEVLTGLANCAIQSGIGFGHRGGGRDDAIAADLAPGAAPASQAFDVRALGGNPVHLAAGLGARFIVTAPATTPVRLAVYDAAGRLVAEPLRGTPVSGTSVIGWDGTDLRGMRVASGTYFYRATAGTNVAGGRIVVVH